MPAAPRCTPSPLRRRRPLALGALAVLAAAALAGALAAGPRAATQARSGTAAATAYPLTIDNCGERVIITAAPRRAISLNQGATEIMLALGLQQRLIGTAYLDDARIYPAFARAYAQVPVIAQEYPSAEVTAARAPDFLYASYSSAFTGKAVGTRDALRGRGVASYLSPNSCISSSRPITFADVFAEIRQVGRIFDVQARAEALVSRLEARLAKARALVQARAGSGPSVLWYDSGAKAPYVGGCCGAPGLIIREAGGRNVFQSLRKGWAEGSWETVVAADPDVIVLVDAVWDTAAAKRKVLAAAPLSGLAAVRQQRTVVIPFGASTPGFRNVDAVELLARALAKAAS